MGPAGGGEGSEGGLVAIIGLQIQLLELRNVDAMDGFIVQSDECREARRGGGFPDSDKGGGTVGLLAEVLCVARIAWTPLLHRRRPDAVSPAKLWPRKAGEAWALRLAKRGERGGQD